MAGRELVGVRGALARSAERRERLDLGRDSDGVGLGRDIVVLGAAGLERHQLDLAAVQLVMGGEEVDVLLVRGELGLEAGVTAALFQDGLGQRVGLGLVDGDGDGVLGHAGCGGAAVVTALPRDDARRRVPERDRDLPGLGVAVGSPVDVRALGLGLVEGEGQARLPTGVRRPSASTSAAGHQHRRDRDDDDDGDDRRVAAEEASPGISVGAGHGAQRNAGDPVGLPRPGR